MARPTTKSEPTVPVSRRDEILAAAAKVIAERGIKQATVRDIGEAAGILSGSLYYHFDSKDQIVLELLLPGMQQSYESAQAICDANTGLDCIRHLIRDSVLATAANPDRALILRNEARLFTELPSLAPIAEIRSNIVGLWLRAIEQGIAAGEIRKGMNADIVVRAILDGTLGASRWFSEPRSTRPAKVIESLVDLYTAGLQKH